MDTILKLLYAVTITVLLVSCGGNDKTHDDLDGKKPKLSSKTGVSWEASEVLNKKSLISGYTESFDFNLREEKEGKTFNITMIVMSADMNCIADTMLCEEISSFMGGKKLVFSSSEEYALIGTTQLEVESQYRMMQKGTIEINDNTYIGALYYSGKGNEKEAWFKGKLVFDLPAIKLLKREPLIIEIKGKQFNKEATKLLHS